MFAVVNEGHVSGLKGGAGATQLQLLPSGNVDLVLLQDSLFQEKLDIWLLDEISSLKCWQLIKKKNEKTKQKKATMWAKPNMFAGWIRPDATNL